MAASFSKETTIFNNIINGLAKVPVECLFLEMCISQGHKKNTIRNSERLVIQLLSY